MGKAKVIGVFDDGTGRNYRVRLLRDTSPYDDAITGINVAINAVEAVIAALDLKINEAKAACEVATTNLSGVVTPEADGCQIALRLEKITLSAQTEVGNQQSTLTSDIEQSAIWPDESDCPEILPELPVDPPGTIPEEFRSCYEYAGLAQQKSILMNKLAALYSQLKLAETAASREGPIADVKYAGAYPGTLVTDQILASAEIAGKRSNGVYLIDERWTKEDHGYLTTMYGVHGKNWFFNAAIYPLLERERPTFRTATISSLDYDNATAVVSYDDVTFTARNGDEVSLNGEFDTTALFLNQALLNCALAGDGVVIRFDGGTIPVVVGFTDEDKNCAAYITIIVSGTLKQWINGVWVTMVESPSSLFTDGFDNYYLASTYDRSSLVICGGDYDELTPLWFGGGTRSAGMVANTFNTPFSTKDDYSIFFSDHDSVRKYDTSDFSTTVIEGAAHSPGLYDETVFQGKVFKGVTDCDFETEYNKTTLITIPGYYTLEPNERLYEWSYGYYWSGSVATTIEEYNDPAFDAGLLYPVVNNIEYWEDEPIYYYSFVAETALVRIVQTFGGTFECEDPTQEGVFNTYEIWNNKVNGSGHVLTENVWAWGTATVSQARPYRDLEITTFSFSSGGYVENLSTSKEYTSRANSYHIMDDYYFIDTDEPGEDELFKIHKGDSVLYQIGAEGSVGGNFEGCGAVKRNNGDVLCLVQYEDAGDTDLGYTLELYKLSGVTVTKINTLFQVPWESASGWGYWRSRTERFTTSYINGNAYFFVNENNWDTGDYRPKVIRVGADDSITTLTLPFTLGGHSYANAVIGGSFCNIGGKIYATGSTVGGWGLWESEDYGDTWVEAEGSQIAVSGISNAVVCTDGFG
jgi:hypothetical protein